jgi:hypothetical protein
MSAADIIGSEETAGGKKDPLTGRLIPLTLAVMATLIGLFQVIADKQGADEIKGVSEVGSKWGHFQAKSTKHHMFTVARDQLRVMEVAMPAGATKAREIIADYDRQILKYEAEKQQIERDTRVLEAENELLGRKGDKYDLCNGVFSIALAFLAMAALRGSRGMFLTSVALGAIGAVFGFWGVLLR